MGFHPDSEPRYWHADGLAARRGTRLRLLAPDDPAAALDPTVAIAAIVQRDFQRVVVVKGGVEVSPEPDTLVNIPTRFIDRRARPATTSR